MEETAGGSSLQRSHVSLYRWRQTGTLVAMLVLFVVVLLLLFLGIGQRRGSHERRG
jgi:hypothetical protein